MVAPIPPKPRLTLRVGFAGNRNLPADSETPLRETLRGIFRYLREILVTAGKHGTTEAVCEPVTRHYADGEQDRPLVRLITGLCEGADDLAAEALFASGANGDASVSLAAVLPFPLEQYRQGRALSYRPRFDELAARCEYVTILDGIYDKPEPPTPLADLRRSRGYRAQSTFLLRHSDLLVVVADATAPGKAGGTLETAQAALAFELPVIFVDLSSQGSVRVIAPRELLSTALARDGDDPWKPLLRTIVLGLVADPDQAETPDSEGLGPILQEFFDRPDTPPSTPEGKRHPTRHEQRWGRFQKLFESAPKPQGDPRLAPYDEYRRRATDLNYHYSGLYRGGFLFSYLCGLGAALIGAAIATVLALKPHPIPLWLSMLLMVLAVIKLTLLVLVGRNARQSRREEWNERAINYRYLAERLRLLYYLPELGSFQLPVAAIPQYASRAVRQSPLDWLYEAVVRSVSPASLKGVDPQEFPAHDGVGTIPVRVQAIADPASTLRKIQQHLILQQSVYHRGQSVTQGRVVRTTRFLNRALAVVATILVVTELLVITGGLRDFLPNSLRDSLEPTIPVIVLLAVALPATLAAINGIRFQSECRQLAERSAIMTVLLTGRPQVPAAAPPATRWQRVGHAFQSLPILWRHIRRRAPDLPPLEATGGRFQECEELLQDMEKRRGSPTTDPGSWAHDALHFAERLADDFAHEVTEWSVLYAREFPGS